MVLKADCPPSLKLRRVHRSLGGGGKVGLYLVSFFAFFDFFVAFVVRNWEFINH